MVSLCGAPDGIRLFNTVHNIQLKPRLNIFVTLDQRYFNAVYLLGEEKVRALASQLTRLLSNPKSTTTTTASASSKEDSSTNVDVKTEYSSLQSTSSDHENSTNIDDMCLFLKVPALSIDVFFYF